MKKILYFIIVLVLLVAIAGFFKFNFSNDDVYAQDKEGNWVQVDKL